MAFVAASSTGGKTRESSGVPAGADVARLALCEREADPEHDKRRDANDDDQNFPWRILPRLVAPSEDFADEGR
jgi:hypothetical protein